MSRVTQITMASLAVAAILAGGCVGEPGINGGGDDDGEPSQATETTPVPDAVCLRKMALDLTHASPTPERRKLVERVALRLVD